MHRSPMDVFASIVAYSAAIVLQNQINDWLRATCNAEPTRPIRRSRRYTEYSRKKCGWYEQPITKCSCILLPGSATLMAESLSEKGCARGEAPRTPCFSDSF